MVDHSLAMLGGGAFRVHSLRDRAARTRLLLHGCDPRLRVAMKCNLEVKLIESNAA